MKGLTSGALFGTLGVSLLLLPASTTYGLEVQEDVRREESSDYYQQWLNEDVVYVISPEERDVFEKLRTPEEKERFIEQFWSRRDPDPRTSESEFKLEHYRRVAYANEHFKAGKSGWRTDRGRIYILYGPPEQRETHPMGKLYTRKLSEGGGQTKTFPYEVWHYRFIPGLGQDVVVEFVDSDLSGDYKIALHGEEKDALLYVPGAGETMLELLGAQTRADRIREMPLMRSSDASRPGLGRERSFDRMQQYFALRSGETVRNPDLRQKVETDIRYEQLPFSVRTDHFWVFEQSFLAAVTIEVQNRELTFELSASGSETSSVHLYGTVYDLSGKRVFEFEEALSGAVTHDLERSQGRTLFQKVIPLDAGRYKLTLLIEDRNSDKLGSAEKLVLIPKAPADRLSTSSLILADRIYPLPGEAVLGVPFTTVTGFKVYPVLDARITGEKVGVYVEIYNFAEDQSTGQAELEVLASIQDESSKTVWSADLSRQGAVKRSGDRINVSKYIYLDVLEPGSHQLVLSIRDRISGEQVQATASFEYQQ